MPNERVFFSKSGFLAEADFLPPLGSALREARAGVWRGRGKVQRGGQGKDGPGGRRGARGGENVQGAAATFFPPLAAVLG